MLLLFSRKAKGAAIIAALFSVSLHAQELVAPGNLVAPHQPPLWFVRMAQSQPQFVPELDSFMAGVPERVVWHGKVPKPNIKYPCKPELDNQGVLRWQFCDM